MTNPFDPDSYAALMAAEIPAYARLQAAVAAACTGVCVRRILDLGTGTGETARRVLSRHPDARLVVVDENARMLAAARLVLPPATVFHAARLQDPLPSGPFDLVVSALAVHHLDGSGKADLFRRVGQVLRPGGTFVLGDLIIPDDTVNVVTPIDGIYDTPSRLADQCDWLRAVGFKVRTPWIERDLAVLVGTRPE